MRSKISRAVLNNVAEHAGVIPPDILRSITQAGGGTLYDLNGNPVYYEVAIDKPEYDYIVANKLYDAYKQAAFAQTHVIALPIATKDNPLGAVEIKAAWKVLSDAEKQPCLFTNPEKPLCHFHTVQALVGGSNTPVTVGLVGFHMFILAGVSGSSQGAWATFAQVDNAPVQGSPIGPAYNFFNPNCKVPGTSSPCPVNVMDADPGQVMQITADASQADKLNAHMKSIIKNKDPNSPWQYYKLIDVQWPKHPANISNRKPPLSTPLPNGDPNVPLRGKDMVNPVIETFAQLPPTELMPVVPPPGLACLSCHQYASTSPMGPHLPPYATSYSFIFGHASSLPTGQQR